MANVMKLTISFMRYEATKFRTERKGGGGILTKSIGALPRYQADHVMIKLI